MWLQISQYSLLGIGAGILTLAHVVLSAGVSIHILRRKRDVGAAMAWMGLVWLSPFLGSLLYLGFGINRVKRRARRLRKRRPRIVGPKRHRAAKPQPDHFAPLELAASLLTQRPMQPGNDVRMLRNGDEAYPLMIAAIEGAKHSIGLSSYIFRVDVAGNQFIDALARACRRGVAVRVLIDGFGGNYIRSPAWHRLRQEGVPAARFLHTHVPWRMPFLNLRNHKKILCVDGHVGFTGGLNISADNLLKTKPPNAVRDTHFRFEGPVVDQLVEAFTEDWQFTTGEDLDSNAWFPREVPTRGSAVARAIKSGPDEDFEKIEFVTLHAISCARQSIRILTPYFLPHDGLITALELAAMRGVEVEIVVPQHTDQRLADWARRAQIQPLVESEGCHVYLSPPPFEHSKLMVVDDAWAMIGSANWDTRSFRLNFELNVEIHDARLTRQISEAITRRRGPELTPDQVADYPFLVEMRDRAARLLLPYL